MRYVVRYDEGKYYVYDVATMMLIEEFEYKDMARHACDILNEENKPMTPKQQHTERLRDCIKQVRSTLNQMERELETIEAIG